MQTSSFSEDYYKILQLPHKCSQEDIAESYRHLSLKFHPKVSSIENAAQSEYHFQQLCEAYEVLSDPIKKEIYDIYGHEGLKNGIIDKNGKKRSLNSFYRRLAAKVWFALLPFRRYLLWFYNKVN